MSELDNELPSSDESDEDFVPSGEENLPSEEDSDGENESDQDNQDDTSTDVKKNKNKRSKQNKKNNKRTKIETPKEEEEEVKEEPKKNIDDLWAQFTSSDPVERKKESSTSEPASVTQVCQFAGELVKIEKTVPNFAISNRGRARGGGLTGILGNLGKQTKLSVLDKSKLDWQQFKQKEGIEEELSTFNKGKEGYLEKQEFLQRADLRQFEIEKELRNSTRKTLR